jgi:hypothetical protein
MTTPIVLTGGEIVFGTAVNNTGTDNFLVGGADNTIYEGWGGYGGGNLIVNGSDSLGVGWDTATTINLGSAYQVTDQVRLDGADNVLQAAASGDSLYESTVSFVVTGAGLSTSAQGHNVVNLVNTYGTSGISLTGSYNNVVLNSNATNNVVLGGSHSVANIGVGGDLNFGFDTSVKLKGVGNTVVAGDQNVMVNGTGSKSSVTVGDGNNSIYLTGTGNTITAWGGTNVINAGSGGDTVNILGSNGTSNPTFVYYPYIPIGGPPTDTVMLAGSGDKVTATYENMMINGSGVTGNTTLNFGVGNNAITLGGNTNSITLGDGDNNVALTGNGNAVTVNDTIGVGIDNVTLGNGINNSISFGYAGGSVASTGSGPNTVSQSPGAYTTVNVELYNGVGLISLGNGNDTVTANGAGSTITLGNGGDTVTANGDGTVIALGNGGDVVTANGNYDVIAVGSGGDTITANGLMTTVTAGSGNDLITANGNGAVVAAGYGNDTVSANGAFAVVTLGSGNDNVSANGDGAFVIVGNGNDTVSANGANASVTMGYGNDSLSLTGSMSIATINANSYSHDSVTLGSTDSLNISGGTDNIYGTAGDAVYANALKVNSSLQLTGNNNMAFIGSDSSVNVLLNQAQSGDQITIQADNGNTYGGVVDISYFDQADLMTLNGLVGGITDTAINSLSSIIANMTAGPNADTLHLAGGGSIVFSAVTGFTSSEFAFGTHTGPV